MLSIRLQWISMDMHGFPRISTDHGGRPWIFTGTPMTGFKKLEKFSDTLNFLKLLGPIETLLSF